MMADVSSCKSSSTPNQLVDDSEYAHVVDAKTSDKKEPCIRPSILVPNVDSEAESGKIQVLLAQLDFLRDSCKIVLAQKNRLLARKDGDISRLGALLAQKNDEVASLKAQLAAVHQTVETVTIERDEAVARATIAAHNLDHTHADYDTKIASLKLQATDVESSAETLRTTVQQQKIELSAALLENKDLHARLARAHDVYDSRLKSCRSRERKDARTIARQAAEIVVLTKGLKGTSPQLAVHASPLYRFQSFMYRRSGESESDSSFYLAKASPPRWLRYAVIRRVRKP